ncbi:MAG TPA: FtsX-like permease family protein, partial [Gemmatimonadaceae bacterium]
NESAIGKRINFNRGPFYHVVGVADDITKGTVDGRALEVVYFPMRPIDNAKRIGTPVSTSLVVRTTSDNPIALVPAVTRMLSELEPQGAVYRARTMETTVARSMARHSFTMVLLLVSALVAMVLSAVGIYGVISYIVGQRKGEIGIRMALGAGVGQIRTMIVGESLGLCIGGIVTGLVAAIAVTRVLGTLLYGVRPSDPTILGAVTLLLVMVSLAASYVPARRASRADPSEALRAD